MVKIFQGAILFQMGFVYFSQEVTLFHSYSIGRYSLEGYWFYDAHKSINIHFHLPMRCRYTDIFQSIFDFLWSKISIIPNFIFKFVIKDSCNFSRELKKLNWRNKSILYSLFFSGVGLGHLRLFERG